MSHKNSNKKSPSPNKDICESLQILVRFFLDFGGILVGYLRGICGTPGRLKKFARPWPRACQIIDYVLLIFIFSTFSSTTFQKFSNENEIKQHFLEKNEFEQQFLKLLLELLFLLEKARMRGGLSGSPGKGQYMVLFTWAGTFFYLFFCILFFHISTFNISCYFFFVLLSLVCIFLEFIV